MQASKNPARVRLVTLVASGGWRACGTKATTITVPVDGPPSRRPDVVPKRGTPATHRGAHQIHKWSIEANSNAKKSEDSYYIPDDYHSDDFGYDSNMYKKCWEDDF